MIDNSIIQNNPLVPEGFYFAQVIFAVVDYNRVSCPVFPAHSPLSNEILRHTNILLTLCHIFLGYIARYKFDILFQSPVPSVQ